MSRTSAVAGTVPSTRSRVVTPPSATPAAAPEEAGDEAGAGDAAAGCVEGAAASSDLEHPATTNSKAMSDANALDSQVARRLATVPPFGLSEHQTLSARRRGRTADHGV